MMKLAASILALSLLIPTTILGQVLEPPILLPDSLGPLVGPYCLTWSDDPACPRLYVGGEGSENGVIVVDAATFRWLPRIRVGSVNSLCVDPTRRELYLSRLDTVSVVNCATNQVIKTIPASGRSRAMVYNRQEDRLYRALFTANSVAVIDCATDSLVHTIAVPGRPSVCALDSVGNKLYVGTNGPLVVIDCSRDSVVATIPQVSRLTGALLFNATARKVYATLSDTLAIVDAVTDSVRAKLKIDSLAPLLACDPVRNRVYCMCQGLYRTLSIDGAGDSVLLSVVAPPLPSGLECDPVRDRVYCYNRGDALYTWNGSTGQREGSIRIDGGEPVLFRSAGLDQLYCLPYIGEVTVLSCSTRSVIGVVPLQVSACGLSVDSTRNKLYVSYPNGWSIGAIDCTQNTVTRWMAVCDGPWHMCFNVNNDRLYSSGRDSIIAVVDCVSDSVLKWIPVSGVAEAFQLHAPRNKLYAATCLRDINRYRVDVVNCNSDSIEKSIRMPREIQFMCLLPEEDMLWCMLSLNRLVVVDCRGDSIVTDTTGYWGGLDQCLAPEDRKLLSAGGDGFLRIVDMDSLAHVESIPRESARNSSMQQLIFAPNARKVYWTAIIMDSDYQDSVYVIDTRTNAVVSRFRLDRTVAEMSLDHTGRYVYCTSWYDSLFFVIDTQTDSVVATLTLPVRAFNLSLNIRTRRFYMNEYDYAGLVPVIRDSVLVGLAEREPKGQPRCINPTLVRCGVPLRTSTPAVPYDASGRRVAVLRPGLNDIHHLAPGVYFRRQESDGKTSKILVVK